MVRNFTTVLAFEPLAENRECFELNLKGKDVTLYPYALGSSTSTIEIELAAQNSGKSHISKNSTGVACMTTLDSFNIQDVGFIKIDVEGYEYEVIQGAEQTIKTFRPVIIVEQKPLNAERFGRNQFDAVRLLRSWGMVEMDKLAEDHILRW
jgi:FkbM family methyltransferase